jgi:hypothetical protein
LPKWQSRKSLPSAIITDAKSAADQEDITEISVFVVSALEKWPIRDYCLV